MDKIKTVYIYTFRMINYEHATENYIVPNLRAEHLYASQVWYSI